MEKLSIISLVGIFISLIVLFAKPIYSSPLWRATITPLASIIGSGFLIAAPILHELAGKQALLLMGLLCLISFGIGQVIRWNISDVEPILDKGQSQLTNRIEKLSDISLALAFVLSVTYYLYLFSSFLLKAGNLNDPTIEKGLVTLVIGVIAYFGHQHGLNSLEKIESVSVNIKLSIIISFLIALFSYDYLIGENVTLSQASGSLELNDISKALGLLIMVQGFETSRYLGAKYSQKARKRSMMYAQLFSTLIYLALIFLFGPVFASHHLHEKISETSVIDYSELIFGLAPTLLLLAAITSQLSAAIADTAGCGGLVEELTKKKVTSQNAYLILAGLSIILVWFFNIFSIISYASKAFALYYFLQCLSCCAVQWKLNKLKFWTSSLFALVCLAVVILGTPFE